MQLAHLISKVKNLYLRFAFDFFFFCLFLCLSGFIFVSLWFLVFIFAHLISLFTALFLLGFVGCFQLARMVLISNQHAVVEDLSEPDLSDDEYEISFPFISLF